MITAGNNISWELKNDTAFKGIIFDLKVCTIFDPTEIADTVI